MADQEKYVQLQRSESSGLGFSVFGGWGSEFPPIIYDIIEDSPAAESGELEAGDVILEINDKAVYALSTKEVLKCLRLSGDSVSLKLKRDPSIKARVKQFLASSHKLDKLFAATDSTDCVPEAVSPNENTVHANGDCQKKAVSSTVDEVEPASNENDGDPFARPKPKARFEAYMMTGDLILNLSRTPQNADYVPQQKCIDSLRHSNSVPTSPNEMDMGFKKGNNHNHNHKSPEAICSPVPEAKAMFAYSSSFVRTSKSEDHLQFQKDSLGAVDIDVDEDVTSSLNTLLDPRPESDSANDRIVWTYNAPVSPDSVPSSASSSGGMSPQQSFSPNSPTSISSSIMSSDSPKKQLSMVQQDTIVSSSELLQNGDVSEGAPLLAASDNRQEDRRLLGDESDRLSSDGTSESERITKPASNLHDRRLKHSSKHCCSDTNKIIIEVRGPELGDHSPKASPGKLRRSRNSNSLARPPSPSSSSGNITPEMVTYQELRESEEEMPLTGESDDTRPMPKQMSPPLSEDDSDVESLHSFHYSPKAVDLPSATRLAKRLFGLDGFKKSDVSRHLSKNNDFSRVVAEEYLKYFTFETDTLDVALRKFLKQFSLAGETQERERVLLHFSKRFLDCNPGTFNSQDAVHTLTCAIMLLNTDLHGQNVGRKMTCSEFIENLTGLNEGDNFPREVLKQIYQAIKLQPLEWAVDEDGNEMSVPPPQKTQDSSIIGHNPFLEVPNVTVATEYKKGYVMRKCCVDANGKKTPFGRRGWKMFYCTLKDLVLYLHKDEHGGQKNQLYENLHNAIRVHHSVATKASEYTKKQYVFRLQTADQAEYLFQTSDAKELQSWMDTINFVSASLSAPPLASAVGSQRKFQRPLLPCSHTKLNMREQLASHEQHLLRLEVEFEEHRSKHLPERGSKAQVIQNHKEKDTYMQFELKRYKTYVSLLHAKLAQYPELEPSLVETSIGEVDERAEMENDIMATAITKGGGGSIVPPPIPERVVDRRHTTDRYSYRAAIYNNSS